MLLCAKCHASDCPRQYVGGGGHVGKHGTCELCGAETLITECDRVKLEAVERQRASGVPMGTCFSCGAHVVRPQVLVQHADDGDNRRVLACERCADQPWPMSEVSFDLHDEGERAVYAATVRALERQAQREARRGELMTRSASSLVALIEAADEAKEQALDRVAALEERQLVMMDELEDALTTRDSLSSQLEETHARLNVHKKEYPRMFYHRDGKTAVVQDAKNGMKLRRTGEWFDHPDKAAAARERLYNLRKPKDIEINDQPDGALAAMSPKERAERIGQELRKDQAHRPAIDESRVDVTVQTLDRMKIPGKVQ